MKRVRGDTFGYLQRSFLGCVSDVDAREAREVGEKAVQFAMWGERNGSVAIQRCGDYAADYKLVPLADVAGKTRVMEDAFITDSGNDVTDAFRLVPAPAARLGAARGPSAAGRRGGQGAQGQGLRVSASSIAAGGRFRVELLPRRARAAAPLPARPAAPW